MAQRQFRSDDTSIWADKFGNGTAGSATLSGTSGNGTACYNGACSGTAGQTSLTTPNGWGVSYGGWPCIIHQTQGTGAGNWELNFITTIVTTTSTLKYPLINSYGTGAQVVLLLPYSGVTVSGTLTSAAWNATYGGILGILCNGTTTISGTVTATGTGFGGGVYGSAAGTNQFGEQGDSPDGNGTRTYTANGSGGGGGSYRATNEQGNSGGGGGNGTAGTDGTGSIPAGGYVGLGGAADGNAGLTDMAMAGGGGGGGVGDAVVATGSGGNGGGIIVIISKVISISGAVVSGGNVGQDGSNDQAAGGGGAGGSVLVKSQTATLGSSLITAPAGAGGGGGYTGGPGGVGRIHLDYMVSYSGTTTPTLDVRQDFGLRLSQSQSVII